MSGLAEKVKSRQDVTNIYYDALVGFAALLEGDSLDLSDAQTFQTIVFEATTHYSVKPKRLADHFGVNLSTVGRWAEGKNAPHPMARPVIVSWILDVINQQIEDIKPTE